MARLVSYKDPGYDDIEARVTASLGLPDGLLGAIRTKGEKSNADQVSSAGARSVYQVIPATRRAAIDRWGIDPYVSAENAAEVAGRLLKENLDRANGDVAEAVAQYHAGTNPKARGPVNRAYVARVTGQVQQAAAKRPVAVPARVLESYNSGQMTAAQAQSFKKAIDAGQVTLPEGAQLNPNVKVQANPGASLVPPRVVQNYSDPGSSMTNAQRDLIDRDIAAGTLRLPEGAQLVRPPNPADRSFAENMGRGVRNIATGVGAVGDIAAGALNATINLGSMAVGGDPLLSTSPFRDIANNASDAAGLKAPETRIDRLVAAGSEGAVGGMTGAGAGAALAGLPGAVGATGRMLSAAPILDTVSGATSGVSSEVAAQNGAGPIGQLVAGLAGGVVPVGAVGAARAVAPKARVVVRDTPREVILDDAGKLTDEGREIAAREGVTADELAEAYDAPEPQMVRTYAGKDYPVEVIDPTPVVDAEGVPHIKVRGEDGAEGFVPQNEVREGSGFGPRVEEPSPAAVVDEAAPAPAQETPGQAAPETPTATARVQEAQSLGVDLTRGQATNDPALQARENDLAATQTPEGQQVQQHLDRQKVAIKEAADTFQAKLGDTSLTATERGEAVKVGLRDLFSQGKAGVTAAYGKLRDMVAELGDNSKGLIDLDTAPLRAGVLDLLADDTVKPEIRNGLTQIAAKYGIIGQDARHIPETGKTIVKVMDDEGNLVNGPSFSGRVEPLTLANAEKFRQRLNDLYDKLANRNPQEGLKRILDDAAEAAAERAAKEGFGDVGKQAKVARDEFKDVKKTFESGDVIDKLVSWKKGQPGTEAINPEAVFTLISGKGPGALTNIRKMKAVLLSSPTAASRAAWRAIQAHEVAELFRKATVHNTNMGDLGFGKISGSKLNTEIQKFGVDKLRTILDPADFDHLMKIKRVAMAADIPLPGTTNPSGSGHVVARLLGNMAGRLSGLSSIPGVGPGIAVVESVVKQAKALATTKETVKGVTEFTPEAAKAADAPREAAKSPGQAAQDFLDLASSERLLAPLLAATQGQQRASQEQASERQAP